MTDPPPTLTSDPFPGPAPPPPVSSSSISPPLLRNPSSSSFDASPLPYDSNSLPHPSAIPLTSNHLPPAPQTSNPSLSAPTHEQSELLSSPSSAYTAELSSTQEQIPISARASPIPSPDPNSNPNLENDYSNPLPSTSSVQSPPPPLAHHSSSSNSYTSQSNGQSGIGIGITGTGAGNSTHSTQTQPPIHPNQIHSYRSERLSEDQQAPVVPIEFDEGVLRALCDLDVRSFPFPISLLFLGASTDKARKSRCTVWNAIIIRSSQTIFRIMSRTSLPHPFSLLRADDSWGVGNVDLKTGNFTILEETSSDRRRVCEVNE